MKIPLDGALKATRKMSLKEPTVPKREYANAVVDGWFVNIRDVNELILSVVAQLMGSSESFMVFTLNLDHLVKLRRNNAFREAYARAKYVTADGFPVVTLARLSGFHIERTTGADLIEPTCEIAAQRNLPIFLIGSTLPALSASASYLMNRFPRLDIRGAFAPPPNFDPNSRLADEVIAMLSAAEVRLCFVALGAPRQELFSAKAMERTAGICFLPIGAGLDFIAGAQKRSPKLLQDLHLEWAWRLVQEPRRLARRYALCAILFLELLLKHYYSWVHGRKRTYNSVSP
jgi:N-acetylglucosaminyldiphosphoundecaprenol N-acetyl-beta-D-mannosaminyltransferase